LAREEPGNLRLQQAALGEIRLLVLLLLLGAEEELAVPEARKLEQVEAREGEVTMVLAPGDQELLDKEMTVEWVQRRRPRMAVAVVVEPEPLVLMALLAPVALAALGRPQQFWMALRHTMRVEEEEALKVGVILVGRLVLAAVELVVALVLAPQERPIQVAEQVAAPIAQMAITADPV